MLPALFNPRTAFAVGRPGSWGRLSCDLDRMFDGVFGPTADGLGRHALRVDAWEDEDHVYLAADLPGLTKDDVDVSIDEGILTITAHRKEESERKERDYHVRERRYGTFDRRFRLPDTVDRNEIHAGLKDGVLTVALNKTEDSKPRTIEVTEAPEGQD